MLKLKNGRRQYSKKKAFRRFKAVYNTTQSIVTKKIEIDVPVYVVNNNFGVQYYSFATGSAPVLAYEILNTAFLTDEFKRIGALYGLYRLTGVQCKYARSINAALNTVYSLPDMSIIPAPEESATYITKESFYSADGAMRVQPLNNDGKMQTKYWKIPGDMTVNGGYTIPGPRGWGSTNSVLVGSQTRYFLYIGWATDPNIAAGNAQMASIVITLYMQFGLPRFRTAV